MDPDQMKDRGGKTTESNLGEAANIWLGADVGGAAGTNVRTLLLRGKLLKFGKSYK